MLSFGVIISFVFIFLRFGLIVTGAENEYDQKIDANMNRIARREDAKTYRKNTERSTLGNIAANVVYAPRSYLNLGVGFVEGIAKTLEDTIQGANDQPKNGNLLDYSLGLARGTTFGAETGLQENFAHRFAKVFRDGENPNTSPDAMATDSDIDQATKWAIEKRKAEDAHLSNLAATLHNTLGVATFEPVVLVGDLQQGPPVTLQKVIEGGSDGLQRDGLIGAVEGATTGLNIAYKDVYAGVLGTGLKQNLN